MIRLLEPIIEWYFDTVIYKEKVTVNAVACVLRERTEEGKSIKEKSNFLRLEDVDERC